MMAIYSYIIFGQSTLLLCILSLTAVDVVSRASAAILSARLSALVNASMEQSCEL
jgi:hypothetical protein